MPHRKWSEVRNGFLATLSPEERAEREARRQVFVAAYEAEMATWPEAACSDPACGWQGRVPYPETGEAWPECGLCGEALYLARK